MNEEIEYVKRSTYRLKVMKSLDGSIKMPSEIANDTGLLINYTSATLGQLRQLDLVECINPQYNRGRLYRLTAKGEKVVKNLQ